MKRLIVIIGLLILILPFTASYGAEQGEITAVQVKNYQRKGYKREALKKVLQKIAFASSVKGTIVLELVYM